MAPKDSTMIADDVPRIFYGALVHDEEEQMVRDESDGEDPEEHEEGGVLVEEEEASTMSDDSILWDEVSLHNVLTRDCVFDEANLEDEFEMGYPANLVEPSSMEVSNGTEENREVLQGEAVNIISESDTAFVSNKEGGSSENGYFRSIRSVQQGSHHHPHHRQQPSHPSTAATAAYEASIEYFRNVSYLILGAPALRALDRGVLGSWGVSSWLTSSLTDHTGSSGEATWRSSWSSQHHNLVLPSTNKHHSNNRVAAALVDIGDDLWLCYMKGMVLLLTMLQQNVLLEQAIRNLLLLEKQKDKTRLSGHCRLHASISLHPQNDNDDEEEEAEKERQDEEPQEKKRNDPQQVTRNETTAQQGRTERTSLCHEPQEGDEMAAAAAAAASVRGNKRQKQQH